MLPLPARARLAAFLTLAPAALVALLAGCEQKNTVDPDRSEILIQPVARVEVQRAAPVVKVAIGNRSGEELYNAICTTCHSLGVAGAPKTGDQTEWAPRIALGFETLVQSLTNGKGAMPPRAGIDLTDTEAQRAVAWLANQAGAEFVEPERE
jgi:cytochrome c5